MASLLALLDKQSKIVVALALADFLVVEAHFLAVVCKNKTLVGRGLAILAMLAEILVLVPLFLLNNDVDNQTVGGFVALAAGIGLVTALCYVLSLIKSYAVAKQMSLEGRVSDNTQWIVLAGGILLIAAQAFSSFSFAGIMSIVGLILYLVGLNRLRKAGGPSVISRMYWALVALIVLAIITVIIVFAFAAKVASDAANNGTSTADVQANVTVGVAVIIVLVALAGKYLTLLLTGYWIGDLCCAPADLDAAENGIYQPVYHQGQGAPAYGAQPNQPPAYGAQPYANAPYQSQP